MELRHFRYFVAVAEALHFGKAAERLRIAQPALSIQIRQLEARLGGALFHRAHRAVSLTEAGRLFLDEARQVFERADAAEALVRQALRGEVATLRIGYSANAALSGLLGQAMRSMRAACPGLDLAAREMDPQNQIDQLMRRGIDVGFTTILSREVPRELVATKLADWPLRAILPSGHRLAALDRIPLASLVAEPFVVYADTEADDGLSVFRSIASATPNVAQRTSSAAMIGALVGAGLGVALLPSSLQPLGEAADVVFRPIEGPEPRMDCSLIHRRSDYEPAVKRALAAIRRARPLGATGAS